jgi:hypothetical protein
VLQIKRSRSYQISGRDYYIDEQGRARALYV